MEEVFLSPPAAPFGMALAQPQALALPAQLPSTFSITPSKPSSTSKLCSARHDSSKRGSSLIEDERDASNTCKLSKTRHERISPLFMFRQRRVYGSPAQQFLTQRHVEPAQQFQPQQHVMPELRQHMYVLATPDPGQRTFHERIPKGAERTARFASRVDPHVPRPMLQMEMDGDDTDARPADMKGQSAHTIDRLVVFANALPHETQNHPQRPLSPSSHGSRESYQG
jgi:hypothetical protein